MTGIVSVLLKMKLLVNCYGYKYKMFKGEDRISIRGGEARFLGTTNLKIGTKNSKNIESWALGREDLYYIIKL